tara:strand:+ start:681 stop:1085 length:405 start_codon:yes stop_codon:yes gene_type:complete
MTNNIYCLKTPFLLYFSRIINQNNTTQREKYNEVYQINDSNTNTNNRCSGPTSWDYTPDGGTKETIEETLIWPQAVIGKRWNISSGFTVSPFIGVGYMLGELKASDGTYLELPDGSKADGGLTPNFGIEVGFMF